MSMDTSTPRRTRSRAARCMFALGTLLLAAGSAHSQSGGPYDLSWSSIDGGSATALAGGAFSLGGTTGQPDASAVHGGPFAVLGGFWESDSYVVAVPEEAPGDAGTPLAFRLYAGVPNPFNPSTRIAFDLPQAAPVRLAVYDVRGALVRILAEGALPSGRHELVWDGRDASGAGAASGIYHFLLDAGDRQARQKGLLLK